MVSCGPMKDPFKTLGLAWGAGAEEAKRAYRRLVMQWHPDRNPAPEAEETFKRIKAAFELVSDPLRFAEWERARERNPEAGAEPAAEAAGDEPEGYAGEPAPEVSLSLEEAAFGCEKEVVVERSATCETCGGSGEVLLARSQPCRHCSGCGRLRDPKGTTVICGNCGGKGFTARDSCPSCDGLGMAIRRQTFQVRVPAGVRSGDRIRLAGRAGKGAAADLILHIVLEPHELFELQAQDLHCRVPVSIFRLLAGGAVDVPTLAGSASIPLKPWPSHGLDYRLSGQGFPGRGRRKAGDLRVSFEPVHPRPGSAVARDLLEGLEALLQDDLAAWAPELETWHAKLARRAARD